MLSFTRSLLGVAVLAASAAASAQTFSYVNDFSATNGNPNGAWTYGYTSTLGGPLTLHATGGFSGTFEYWSTDFGFGVPAAAKNLGPSVINGLPPGEAALHGGFDPGEFAIARFTSPGITGDVTIVGSFGPGDGGSVDVHVQKNGVSLFSVLGTFDAQPFSLETSLAATDTIDFVVGRSTDIFFDTTPVAATLVVTPSACPNVQPGCTNSDIFPGATPDCVVDLSDLGEVLSNYAPGVGGKTRALGDIFPLAGGDGVVDLSDLGQMLSDFGTDCR